MLRLNFKKDGSLVWCKQASKTMVQASKSLVQATIVQAGKDSTRNRQLWGGGEEEQGWC